MYIYTIFSTEILELFDWTFTYGGRLHWILSPISVLTMKNGPPTEDQLKTISDH